jgi:hypothetical protein
VTGIALKKMRDALGECWTEEFGELELTVNHTLTEPTCPTAIITTESQDGPSWRADHDSIEEAIYAATAAAYITIVRREPKPMTFPAPDSNEEKRVADFLAALDRRKAA